MFAKLLVLVVLISLAVGLAAQVSQGSGPERSYVVKPGDTLWSIAARSAAGDVRESVWKLRQRNGLRSSTLQPGQVLTLPG